ncbi:hypothetical protein ACFYO1_42225 [Nocardia sp. NPDC006044]
MTTTTTFDVLDSRLPSLTDFYRDLHEHPGAVVPGAWLGAAGH